MCRIAAGLLWAAALVFTLSGCNSAPSESSPSNQATDIHTDHADHGDHDHGHHAGQAEGGQLDMEKIVPENMAKGEAELQFMLEMLVRAYDPCISCSTHYLDVKFKN